MKKHPQLDKLKDQLAALEAMIDQCQASINEDSLTFKDEPDVLEGLIIAQDRLNEHRIDALALKWIIDHVEIVDR